MDAESLSHIFEPFFTTKAEGKGTGMGLVMVYGLIQQHEGWIEVSSQPGRRSRFDIFLPVTTETGEEDTDLPEPPDVYAGEQASILLVEDDPGVRLYIQGVLEGVGHRVLVAEDSVDALKVWEQHAQDIDMLFTDVVMPDGITGVELAGRMIDRKPEIKVIYSSGYNMKQAIPPDQKLLQKPYSSKVLLQTVQQCLAQD